MIHRVSDALAEIAEYVNGAGVDTCNEQGRANALKALNRATRQLMREGDWEGMESEVCIPVHGNCLILDDRIETIRLAKWKGGDPLSIYSSAFKYVEGGFGEMDGSRYIEGMVDLGDGFPTHTPLHRPMPILAYSDREEDEGAVLQIRGMDANGKENLYRLPIRHHYKSDQPPAYTTEACDFWTTGQFQDITELRKAPTNGMVYVYGYDPATGEMCWLTTLRPESISPSHRRYQVAGNCEGSQIVAQVSMRYYPVHFDDEVLLVQNLDALSRMVQSLDRLDASDMGGYESFKNSAISQLKKQRLKQHQGERKALNVRVQRTLTGGRGYSGSGIGGLRGRGRGTTGNCQADATVVPCAVTAAAPVASPAPRPVQAVDGWTPELAVVEDGARRVQQVVDWFGGGGTKPATGSYVGAEGYVTEIASATNIRGAAGSGSGGALDNATLNEIIVEDAAASRTALGLSPVASTGTYASLTGKPTLGTAAAENTSAFDAAGSASGVGTAAASALSTHAAATSSIHGISAFGATLVDDANAAAARATLELGSAATTAAGAYATAAQGTNARTPTAHKSTHATGGTDELTPADIGAATTAAASTAQSTADAAVSDAAAALAEGQSASTGAGTALSLATQADTNATAAKAKTDFITVTQAVDLDTMESDIAGKAAAAHNHAEVYQPLDAQLTDLTALAYAGNAVKVVRVNAGETAFELATISGGGDAVVAGTLDQFADVTQTATKTLAITESTTLAGGTHSGTNTGDQDLSTYQLKPSEGAFVNGDKTKLDAITGTNTGDQSLTGYVLTSAIDTLVGLNAVVTDATLIDTADSRLSDSRTPTSHAHGNITNAGLVGSTAGLPLKTGTGGIVEAGAFGTGAGQFSEGNHDHAGVYQPIDTQLTALAALAYAGNALKVVRVNAGETDLELTTIPPALHSIQGFGPVVDEQVIYGRAVAAFSISDWQITSSDATSGSIELDIWVRTAGLPTVADTIVNANYPAISAATASSGGVVGWTSTTVAAGDYFAIKVRSLTTITAITFAAYGS